MISVCITVKNRAPQLMRCIESLEKLDNVGEIIVSDFNSDDTDFAWFKHKLVKIDDEFFSVGRGKNVAADNAAGDILLFIDADLLVPQVVIDRAIEYVEKGLIYAPIMHMQNEDGSLAEWAIHSFGQVAVSKEEFDSGKRWEEWKSYGGEDNLFVYQYGKYRIVRSKPRHFIHQWHPHELREKYGEAKAYTDLNKFRKGWDIRKKLGKSIIGRKSDENINTK